MKKKVVKVSRFGENSLPILNGPTKFFLTLGRGDCLVVSVLAFCSDDLSSNHARY